MMIRRAFLISALAALAACADPASKASQKPLPFEVREVTLDTTNLKVEHFADVEKFERSPQQVKSDVTKALQTALEASPSGDVDVTVALTKLYLISAVEAAVPGLDSNVTGTIKAVNTNTGETVVEPFEFTAGAPDFHGAGLVGIVLAPGLDKDYTDTITGFAYAVRNRLAEQ
ncbi:hypothetical protein M3P21_18365 [Ruegeria sp. 2012CJ41-6]|uniref:DUF4410 domain-containing protein n=1 Tax=Ruegeria spongiae TaxID=2942209 RepID=A0ABT0Q6P1_9RHOB|nr:hypothetical protein [Ruegeria spongiae]MCL6285498.1 hypothetical protein [Ruegeria spongiae]